MKKNRHAAEDAAFRERIWLRDGGKDRVSGARLQKNTEDFDQRGDVCHLKSKGAHPELRYVPGNACLLSRRNHILSDGRGGYLLKIEGDADGDLTFRRYDKDGLLLWERVSPCPVNHN